ncbi:MAG: VOC family protein [Rhodobacteraceae bacterium]|nr:MAG: VOC family protein [Paracoccaceae bacterium]
MLHLDHLVVSGETRDAAKQAVEAVLGAQMREGGAHAHFGTHNHLLGLGEGLYLEAIAVDPAATPPAHPRWFGLDGFEGPPRFSNWVCRTDDLDTLLRDLPEAGEIVALERGDLKWRIAVPPDGLLPFDGCFPALIQWEGDRHPAATLPDAGCGLERLTVIHPEAFRLQQRLSPYLDDARVHFEEGSPHLTAEITCPRGQKTLR